MRYHPLTVPVAKCWAGWFAPERVWRMPARRGDLTAMLNAFAQLSLPAGFYVDRDSVLGLIRDAVSHPEPAFFVQHLSARLFPLQEGGWVFESQYDPFVPTALHNLSANYERGRGIWRIPDIPLAGVRRVLDSTAGIGADHLYVHDEPLAWDRLLNSMDVHHGLSLGSGQVIASATAQGSASRYEQEELVAASALDLRARLIDGNTLAAIVDQFGLWDYQREGVVFSASRNSSLNADDMGMGKTRQALAAAMLVGPSQTLITTTTSAQINWVRTIQDVMPGQPWHALGGIQDKPRPEARWVVATYEHLQGLARMGYRPEKVVFDEAHRLKELTTQRTQHALEVVEKAQWRCLLTGTPVLNCVEELHPLLRVSGHPLGALPQAAFLQRYAGSSVLRERLRQILESWFIRRLKKDHKSLPPKVTEEIYVSLSTSERSQYDDVANDQCNAGFAKLHAVRREVERLKVPWTGDIVRSLADDDKVIVFCEYIESVEEYSDLFFELGIDAVTITGEDSRTKRQRAMDKFQKDRRTRGCIATTSAAGEAIELTAANYVIFVGLPWTWGRKIQAEDRAYREGQLRSVSVLVPLIPDTIDEPLLELIKSKRDLAESFTGEGNREEQSAMEAIARLLESKVRPGMAQSQLALA